MPKWISAVLLSTLSACTVTGPDDSSDGGTAGAASAAGCVAPSGQYQLNYQETGGGCGAQLTQYLTFDGTKQALSPGCDGTNTSTSGGCHDDFDLRCPLSGGYVQRTGSLDWSADGKSAHGTWTLSWVTVTTDSSGQVIATNPVCTSSYTVELIKS